MSSLSKLSFFLLAIGFLALPFFVFASIIDTANPDGFLQTFPHIFEGFSLKGLDERLYSSLKNKITDQTAVVIYGAPTPPQCNDEADNDSDGTIDMGVWIGDCSETCDYVPPDPDCSSPDDTSEGTTECSDSSDNDGDGAIDLGVTWCVSDDGGGWDCTESPADPECANYADNSESPGVAPGGILTFPGGPCPPLTCGLGGGGTPTINPSIDLYLENNPSVNSHTLVGNAYNTSDSIYWNVEDSCDCAGTPGNWFTATLDGSGDSVSSGPVIINTPYAVAYTLTCNKKPSCNVSAGTNSDSITITPLWSPSVSLSANPTSVNATQSVQLTLSATDVKTCTRSWTSGTLTLSGGNPQTININAGTISAPTTFTVNCIGFNDSNYQASAPVGFISAPTPYFSINSINLIIIGPGSGGRSNKAIVGVTKSGSFTGNITLTAAPASGSESLTNQGAELCLNATDGVTCSSSAIILCTSALSSTCDNTAEFWVETEGDLLPTDYTITLTADPQPPSTLASETKTIPLRVRRFVPAFEEI